MSNPQATMRLGTQTVDAFGNGLATSMMEVFVAFGPSAIFRNCDNCRHMAENGPAVCSLYQMTPPANVIVVGCDKHDDKEDVPF